MDRAAVRVSVLMGGMSAERPGSMMMGRNCAEVLREAGYLVTEIDAKEDVAERLKSAQTDVVFNALMGRWGEDGAIQGLLEWMNIPYTHSGVIASAIGMDKAVSKAVFQSAGLPTPNGRVIDKSELDKGHPLPPPYVLKPVAEGSSIGIQFVWNDSDPVPENSDQLPQALLVEELVPGLDLTVGVVRDEGFEVTMIETESGVWDYTSKYEEPHARYHSPAPLEPEIYARCLELAERAHRALGCRFISRTDLRWDEGKGLDGFSIIETNTQPAIGFDGGTFGSQLEAKGVSLATLCDWLVQDASLRR